MHDRCEECGAILLIGEKEICNYCYEDEDDEDYMDGFVE